MCIPGILFACEVWGPITNGEYERLEKMQHKIAKHLQGLHKRTHNEITLGLLGWCTMKTNIHKIKLLFIRQLINLDNKSIIKYVFLHEMYSNVIYNRGGDQSITSDLMNIVNEYGLQEYVHRYLYGGQFPEKRPWKYIVQEQ